MTVAQDLELVGALWRRDMVKFVRDRQTIVASLARPLLWLFGFGFGLRGAVSLGAAAGPTGDYISFLLPGLAAMSVLFTGMFAAISIVWDREFGFLKELLVAPVPRSAVVVAKMLSGSTMALIEAVLLLVLAPVVGARVSLPGALVGLVVLAVFGMAISALGIAIASRMKSFEGFGGIVNFIIQPLFFLSGALYPLASLPKALRVAVYVNPMTYAVDAVRGLMIGTHHFPLWLDVTVVGATAIALAALATWSFGRMEG